MEKKRYWLKLEKNFLTFPEIKILRKKGYDVVVFYMALMLESTPTLGHLRISDDVPYDNELLAEAFGFDEEFVESSLICYKKLGLIEILDDRTIFMTKVPDMTGKEGESAKRVRAYRAKKESDSISDVDTDYSDEPDDVDVDSEVDDFQEETTIDNSTLLQCNNDVTKCNKKEKNVTKCNDNKEKQSKLTTTEYINKINNVDSKLINKIDISCSCSLKESDFFLRIVYNWVLHFKEKISDIVDRAIEIMSLKNNVENKLFFINGILRNWFFAKCRSIEDVDKLINYEFKFEYNSQTDAAASPIEELGDYDWLEEV